MLPEAKGGAAWLDADTLLLSSALGEGMATTSGYARTVRLWRRGEPVERAQVILRVPADSMWPSIATSTSPASIRGCGSSRPSISSTIISGLATTPAQRSRLDLPTDIWMNVHADWIAVKPRTPWTVGGKTWAADSVIGISLSAFLAGSRDFTAVFEPGPRRALQGWFWTAGKLVLSILDELQPVFEICTPSNGGWTPRDICRGCPTSASSMSGALDRHESESNGDLLASVQDPLTPPSLMLIERHRSSRRC